MKFDSYLLRKVKKNKRRTEYLVSATKLKWIKVYVMSIGLSDNIFHFMRYIIYDIFQE
jgi:hypothetical protein